VRVVKAVGIVVLLILSVAAFAGATGASADIMCKQNENPCAVGNRYAEHTTFTFTAPTVTLTSGTFSVTCKGVFSGPVLRDLGAGMGQEVEVTAVTYSMCTGNCTTATATGLPWIGTFRAGPPATLAVMQRFRLSGCGGFLCDYEAKEAVLNFTGGKGVEAKEPALLKAEGVKLTRGGESSKLFCPETVTEKATFEETEPKTGIWESKEP